MTAKTPSWRDRAETLGLTQTKLARILGRDDTAIYRWLRGQGSAAGQRELKVLILAVEQMTQAQRDRWLLAVDSLEPLEPKPALQAHRSKKPAVTAAVRAQR